MSSTPPRRPNIVLIMSDQHNPHVMGCAGNAYVRTPHLDALAENGVRFTGSYCPYPLCAPSRMAFLTGQYPGAVGMWDNDSVLASHIPTFAHALGSAGYRTALCGRMHFVGHDQFHGFAERVYGDCFHYLAREIQGAGWNRTNGQTRYAVEVSGYGRTGFQAYDREVAEAASGYIARRDPEERPFCLVVGFILPHNPLICPRELFEYYMNGIPVPAPVSGEYLSSLHPAIHLWRQRRGVDDLTPAQNHRGLAAYYGLVTEMDANVGRIVDAVKRSPDSENTIVAYCSDHGDMAGEHGMWWKSSHYEGSAGVPLIFSRPFRSGEAVRVEKNVSLVDVGPTLLDIAGACPLPDIEGRSLRRFLPFLDQAGDPSGSRQDEAEWTNEIFCEYIGAHGDQPSCMIRRDEWKLMYYAEFDSYLLFDLKEDPEEIRDRAEEPACRRIGRELLARISERWSAKAVLDGARLERRRRRVLSECGHPPFPHPVAHPRPPAGANSFDHRQLPDWEAIQARMKE